MDILSELERLERAATQGEWWLVYNASNHKPSGIGSAESNKNGEPYAVTMRNPGYPDQEWIDWHGNGEFIVAARNALPALLRLARAVSAAERSISLADGEYTAQWMTKHADHMKRILEALKALQEPAESAAASR
jgi:hypothetical protein